MLSKNSGETTSKTPANHSGPAQGAHVVAGAEHLADRLADFLARVTPEGNIRFISRPGLEWLGYGDKGVAKGGNLADLVSEGDRGALRGALSAGCGVDRQSLNLDLLNADAMPIRVTCRILPLIMAGARSELLFAAWAVGEAPLSGMDHDICRHDVLTGLPTRSHLLRRLGELTAPGSGAGAGFALMHLDLDGFQKVNDALGHAEGDQLLAEAARRLGGLLRATDLVARTGGDEFALLLPGTCEREAVTQVARKILTAMQRPYVLGDSHLHLSASIGVALCPEHGGDGAQLFKCADIALATAKGEGGNCLSFYRPEGGEASSARVALEERMYEAIQNGEFEMHYQPLWRTASREMVAVEALMRWNRPGQGFISPAEFIPLAESNGLIGFLGSWSLRASCHQVARWNEERRARLKASVNLSPIQFRQGNIVELVKETLSESGLAPDCLILEITEGTLMHDPTRTESLLNALRSLGVGVSVDDFGTGYSSLAYLKRFPISSVKIDQSFVGELEKDPNDLAIVSAILGLAKELGLCAVAEGVETEGQLAILCEKGCDMVQGYLLGRPVAAEEWSRRVEQGEWRLVP